MHETDEMATMKKEIRDHVEKAVSTVARTVEEKARNGVEGLLEVGV
jgi:hypothetical protein